MEGSQEVLAAWGAMAEAVEHLVEASMAPAAAKEAYLETVAPVVVGLEGVAAVAGAKAAAEVVAAVKEAAQAAAGEEAEYRWGREEVGLVAG